MLASGVDALLPANRGNEVARAGLRRLSCHGWALAKSSRSSTPSRESAIWCRSTSGSGQDLAISHKPRDLIGCVKDCEKLQFDQNVMDAVTCRTRDQPMLAPSARAVARRCACERRGGGRCADDHARRVTSPDFRHAADSIEQHRAWLRDARGDVANNGRQWPPSSGAFAVVSACLVPCHHACHAGPE